MSPQEPRGPGKRPGWWPWVRDQMRDRWGRENIARLAREGDFNRSIVYQWQDGGDVEPATVGAVAAALGANPIDAFIAAGFFTEDDFDEYRSRGTEIGLSNGALAAEVLRRMNAAGGCGAVEAATDPDDGPEVTDLPSVQGGDAAVVDSDVDPGVRARRRADDRD